MFNKGNCVANDAECKLAGFDQLPVQYGFTVKSGNAYSVQFENPFGKGNKKSLSDIFASLPAGGPFLSLN